MSMHDIPPSLGPPPLNIRYKNGPLEHCLLIGCCVSQIPFGTGSYFGFKDWIPYGGVDSAERVEQDLHQKLSARYGCYRLR